MKEVRRDELKNNAKQPTILRIVGDAMVAIERDNPTLEDILPQIYAWPALGKERLGELIDLIETIGHGDKENHADVIVGADLVIPSDDIKRRLLYYILLLIQRIVTIVRVSSVLVAIRDTLLPKLLSGKIRIENAIKL